MMAKFLCLYQTRILSEPLKSFQDIRKLGSSLKGQNVRDLIHFIVLIPRQKVSVLMKNKHTCIYSDIISRIET